MQFKLILILILPIFLTTCSAPETIQTYNIQSKKWLNASVELFADSTYRFIGKDFEMTGNWSYKSVKDSILFLKPQQAFNTTANPLFYFYVYNDTLYPLESKEVSEIFSYTIGKRGPNWIPTNGPNKGNATQVLFVNDSSAWNYISKGNAGNFQLKVNGFYFAEDQPGESSGGNYYSTYAFLAIASRQAPISHSTVVDSKNEMVRFDRLKFNQYIDTFLLQFTGKAYNYSYRIDTIINNLNRNVLLDTALLKYLINESNLMINHSFLDQKSKDKLDFKLIEIHFDDSLKCLEIFNKLNQYANTRGAIDNFQYIPCLTYQNDRVYNTGTKLFWLNHNCRFSFKTHSKYIRLLKKSFINFNPIDSIICKCGDVVSRTNRD